MIFATVGTQLPFPRLINALDDSIGRLGISGFAQTADPTCSCKHLQTAAHLAPGEFDDHVTEAAVLVGHAGIGTILTAKRFRKPLIIFPRRGDLNEHRNDHQMATARYFEGMKGVYVAWDAVALERLIAERNLVSAEMDTSETLPRLIDHIRQFIAG